VSDGAAVVVSGVGNGAKHTLGKTTGVVEEARTARKVAVVGIRVPLK